MSWGSHKDIAAKALAKLAAPHLPASLKALECAVERAHAEHRSAMEDSADGSHAPAADDDAATEREPSEKIDAEPEHEAEDAECAPGEE